MRKASQVLEPGATDGHEALITLRRGVSAWGTWAFDAEDVGLTILVGHASNCDWQIASPGVGPLFMAYTGESMVVRAVRHDPKIRRNGRIVAADAWTMLTHGDLLDIGPVKLGIYLAGSLRPVEHRRPTKRARRGRAETRVNAERSRSARATSGRAREQAERVPAAVLVRRNDPSRNAPVLFEEAERALSQSQAAKLVLYGGLGVGILVTYLCWVTLLDRL